MGQLEKSRFKVMKSPATRNCIKVASNEHIQAITQIYRSAYGYGVATALLRRLNNSRKP